MRIGLISGEFPPLPGGIGDFSALLAAGLKARGQDVYLFSRAGSKSADLPLRAVKHWGLSSLLHLRAWARENALDIVNLQFQTAAYAMSPWVHFLPAVLGAPLVTTFHDLRFPYLFPKAGPLRDWIVLRLARSSAGIITTNQADAARLAFLPRRRIIPIGSSVPRRPSDPSARAALRQELGTDKNSFLLGHFGFINALKGVEYLLEAVARLRAANYDLRLVFIGRRKNSSDQAADATYQLELDQRLEALGLTEAVHWTGFLPAAAVAAYFNAVDLMTLPFTDGASWRRSSLIAALHQGCAILTTEPTVEIDCFQHKRNLWQVQRASAAAIEAALLHLLHDRSQLQTLRAGAAQLSARFAWDSIIDETISFFEATLAGKPR